MDQSIRVEDCEGKLMFEWSLWGLLEYWKGVGRKAEDFYIPLNEGEAFDLVVLAGLLEPEERAEVKVKLYTPSDWKPMPQDLELFQRDANGEYVRQEPRSEGNYIEPYAPPKEVSEEEEETCDCGCGHSSNKCPYWLAFYFGKEWEERDDKGKTQEEAEEET